MKKNPWRYLHRFIFDRSSMAFQLKLPFLSPSFCYFPASGVRRLRQLSSLSYTRIHSIYSKSSNPISFRISYRFLPSEDDDDDDAEKCSFDEAVLLFNNREYYKCHDFLESLWNEAEDPSRTLIHGILQCAVGFHHLFNQNHKGAMMELGEGLCKLRKMNFDKGPFHQFEREISAALDFIYQTQLELAACSDDMCIAMDQSERSYQLLGGYAAGEQVYRLQHDHNEIMHIEFCPQRAYGTGELPRVKLPTLHATQQHLMSC